MAGHDRFCGLLLSVLEACDWLMGAELHVNPRGVGLAWGFAEHSRNLERRYYIESQGTVMLMCVTKDERFNSEMDWRANSVRGRGRGLFPPLMGNGRVFPRIDMLRMGGAGDQHNGPCAATACTYPRPRAAASAVRRAASGTSRPRLYSRCSRARSSPGYPGSCGRPR